MKFFQTILHILFPKRCVSCKRKEDSGLCSTCIKKIIPLKTNKTPNIISVFPYQNPIMKKVLWEFKFNGDFEPLSLLIDTVSDVLVDELSEKNIFNNFQHPLLVPIPLHKNRHKARGFNQSEIIAYELYKRNPSLFQIEEKGLIRHKETVPQSKIKDRETRLKNIEDCFKVINPDVFFNRNIILIDDVTTTGGTLGEAMRVLKKSGARNIYACTIAK